MTPLEKILIAIPHYFRQGPESLYGSTAPSPEPRLHYIRQCLASLHQTFGPHQGLLHGPDVTIRPSAPAFDLDIVILSTGPHHLLDRLDLPPNLYRHHPTRAEPLMLGFECQALLRDHLGLYDYYCFVEDDLAIYDPLFFAKLAWFTRWAGNDCLLMPNRHEVSLSHPVHKLYHDGSLADPRHSVRYQDITDRRRLHAELLGQTFVFERTPNPHAACFFLNAEQMAHFTRQPHFLDRDIGFWGPLESGATLGIMRTFRLYKPDRPNAGFLEVRHLDNRYLGPMLKIADNWRQLSPKSL